MFDDFDLTETCEEFYNDEAFWEMVEKDCQGVDLSDDAEWANIDAMSNQTVCID